MVFFALFAHDPHIVCVPAGSKLFAEGDDGHVMYVLTLGSAEVSVNNRVVETLEPGAVVGEISIVAPGPRSASVVAKTDCEFVAVDEQRFSYLVQQAPYFATSVMRTLAERLRATSRALAPVDDI
jgi:CRP-like cAMP-binding protein